MLLRPCAALLALLAFVAGPADARPTDPPHWLTSWAAAVQPPHPAMGPIPASPSFNDQTLIQVMRLSAGGSTLRVRLSNEYGTQALKIGAARIGLAGPDGRFVPGTDRPLTFGGRRNAIAPPGAPLVSDPVALPVPALATVAIRLYFPDTTGACTCHGTGLQTLRIAAGNATESAAPHISGTSQERAFVSAIEVSSRAHANGIVVLGDSISDGLGSTLDTNRRWSDLLAARLARRGGGVWAVANMGISGNRVMNGGAGDSALTRLDRDVIAQPGARYLILFMGINDIGSAHVAEMKGPMADIMKAMFPGEPADADQIIAGYRQIVARAHMAGLKVIGATITPFEGTPLYSEDAEAQRQIVNRWIRTSRDFDAMLDFDAVWRDPTQPTRIREAYQSGDHIHGSDAGYRALADSIDLALFR